MVNGHELMESLLDAVAIEFGLKRKKEITDDTEKGGCSRHREGHNLRGKATKTSMESSEKCIYFGW